MKETLGGQFGPEFETQLLHLALFDRRFAEQAAAGIDSDLFEQEKHREIASVFSVLLEKNNGAPPSFSTIKSELHNRQSKLEKKNPNRAKMCRMAIKFMQRLRNQEPPTYEDQRFIEGRLSDFITHKSMESAYLRSLDKHSQGEYDEAVSIIEESAQAGRLLLDQDIGFEFTDYTKKISEYENRAEADICAPSGIPLIDKVMRGGLEPKHLGILLAGTGVGKCLQLGTLVLLYSGKTIKVEDVKPGDLLMGPDSKPRTVTSTNTGRGPLFRITPIKGDSWVCNEDHILTLVESGKKEEAIDIPLRDFLKLSVKGRRNLKQFSVGVEFPDTGWKPPIDPYFLGVWYGDGTKNLTEAGVCISNPDPEIYEMLQAIAEDWNLTVTKHQSSTTSCPTYRLAVKIGDRSKYSGRGLVNPLLDALRAVVGSLEKIPLSYLTGTREVRQSLLAGLLDTDGYLIHGCFEICQKSSGIAEGICFLARSLGMRATMRDKVVKICDGDFRTYKRIFISGDFTDLPLRTLRRIPSKRKQIKDVLRTGIQVEGIGEGEYAGFTLDGDGRFLLGDFTVTHNTMALVNIGCECLLAGLNVIHVTLEISALEASYRYDARMTGLPINEIMSGLSRHKATIRKNTKRLQANLFIKEWGSDEASAMDVRAYLKMLEARTGVIPDVLLVDYADLLRPVHQRKDLRIELKDTMRALRQISKDWDCAVWTASQTNREGWEAERISLKTIAEAWEKATISDVIIALCQTYEEKRKDKMRWMVLKNRQGGHEGHTVDCKAWGSTQLIEQARQQLTIHGLVDSKMKKEGKSNRRKVRDDDSSSGTGRESNRGDEGVRRARPRG